MKDNFFWARPVIGSMLNMSTILFDFDSNTVHMILCEAPFNSAVDFDI